MVEILAEQKRKILIVIISVLSVFLILSLFILGYQVVFAETVFPGVTLNGKDMGGMSQYEVADFLSEFEKDLENGFIFTFADIHGKTQRITVTPEVLSYDLDIPGYKLYTFQKEETLNNLFLVGRQGGVFSNLSAQALALAGKKNVDAYLEINKEELAEVISLALSEYQKPAQNSELMINSADTIRDVKIETGPSYDGLAFDIKNIMNAVDRQIQNLSISPLAIKLVAQSPKITKHNTQKLDTEILSVLELAPLSLTYQEDGEPLQSWPVEMAQLTQILAYDYDEADAEVMVAFDQPKLTEILENISQEINIEPKEARFKLEDEKVVEFQPSASGRSLVIEPSLEQIETDVIRLKLNTSQLVVEDVQAQNSVANLNDLGISELIGVGVSNFSGSPSNRRHNIKTGSDQVNGILIAPGEEFSMLQTLGEIDGAHGYLPELVIKGNKTTPEFGGGLCQTSTTMFRAVLNAGLPITERRNHSYTVRYYFEDGVPLDATIYDPSPDFRFVNDTAAYLLIQTRIDGDDLIYEFWGTKDGREAHYTKPVVYNRVAAPPTKYIQTTDLAPGQQKCTEISHTGLFSTFDYIIKYANGEKNEQTFNSVYKPWPAVCLIGVESVSNAHPVPDASVISSGEDPKPNDTQEASPSIDTPSFN